MVETAPKYPPIPVRSIPLTGTLKQPHRLFALLTISLITARLFLEQPPSSETIKVLTNPIELITYLHPPILALPPPQRPIHRSATHQPYVLPRDQPDKPADPTREQNPNLPCKSLRPSTCRKQIERKPQKKLHHPMETHHPTENEQNEGFAHLSGDESESPHCAFACGFDGQCVAGDCKGIAGIVVFAARVCQDFSEFNGRFCKGFGALLSKAFAGVAGGEGGIVCAADFFGLSGVYTQ